MDIATFKTYQSMIDAINRSAPAEVWGVWNFPVIAETDGITEFLFIKAVAKVLKWQYREPRSCPLFSIQFKMFQFKV